jgi:hypothetical protein
LTRSFRIWGKKRGDRRTGSQRLGSVGEALFFAALFLVGSFALVAESTSQIVRFAAAEAYVSGWETWFVLPILLSLVLTGAGGLARTIMQVTASAERRSALANRARNLEILSDALPSARDFPTVPRNENLTNSPGTTLAFRLPMSSSPGGKLLLSAVFCLLWNGLVAVLAVLAASSHLHRRSNWFLTLFLLPCAAVGARSVYLFLRSLINITGIGPTSVEVSHQPFYPGCAYEVFLTQAGRHLAVKSLRLLFVCEEEAVYRQGTDVRTERRRVHEQQVARAEHFDISPTMRFERLCRLDVPDYVMHSFKSNHNAVSWKLVVEGEFHGWPRFQRDFPVVVYPHVNGKESCRHGTAD